MSSWWAKFVILASTVAMVAIRAPHGQRSRTIKVVKTRKGGLETGLLTFATLAFLLAARLDCFTGFLVCGLSPACNEPHRRDGRPRRGIVAVLPGRMPISGGIGPSTLEIRDEHQLVTGGIYSLVRHPMYLSLLVYSAGQVLVLPNWVVGPSLRGRDGFGLRLPPATRRANDARRIRRRIQGLHATNQTPHPGHLVSAR